MDERKNRLSKRARGKPRSWSSSFIHSSIHPSIPSLFVPRLSLTLLLSMAACLAFADGDRLVMLDGSAADDTVTAIDGEGLVHRESGKPAIGLQGLRRIERPVKPDPPKAAPCAVHLLSGGVLRARGVGFEAGRFAVQWAFGGKLVLPLAAVRAMRLSAMPDAKDDALEPQFEAEMEGGEAKRDALFAIAEKKLQVVRGALVRITDKEVVFNWNDAERKLGRDKVYGLVLAQPGPKPDLTGQCLVHLTDGSSLWGAVAGLEGEKLTVHPADGVDVTLPWSAVCRLDVRSARMAFLSDLDPLDVVQEALVTYAGPWRRDLSVVGGPLTLGKTAYEKGLGVHARCQLTYALDGGYDAFAAVIGLDASTSGKGDCVFRVEADGKPLFEKRMRGADPPVPVRLKLSGAQRLTLIVDYGEDLDLADRADWCDARVLKQGDKP